jgi:HPt (histidine-containing phosphotransfer) domain-containing protein
VDTAKKYTDLTYLSTISKGNKEFTLKFIKTFIKQMAEDLPFLQQHLNDRNWEALANMAHKIKPSFQFVGVKEEFTNIQLIEHTAREQIKLEELQALIANLVYICDMAVTELNDEVQQLTR